mmetsp:Transcript_6014/g.10323  ORF Transcript_6014/g.10323 Transcript_6014/m.10323 type:complete len:221 (+) Transcript_6014:586-1248(+)
MVDDGGADKGPDGDLLAVKNQLRVRCRPQIVHPIADDVLVAADGGGLARHGHRDARHREGGGGVSGDVEGEGGGIEARRRKFESLPEDVKQAERHLVVRVPHAQHEAQVPVCVGDEATEEVAEASLGQGLRCLREDSCNPEGRGDRSREEGTFCARGVEDCERRRERRYSQRRRDGYEGSLGQLEMEGMFDEVSQRTAAKYAEDCERVLPNLLAQGLDVV